MRPYLCRADRRHVRLRLRRRARHRFVRVDAGLAPADALLVQPGTHCKWARMEGERLVGFATAITGELFALLRGGSVLAAQLGGNVTARDAFLAGVKEGRRRDLAASLFGIRAARMPGTRDDADAASYASGLLIGSDVAARLAEHDHATVHIFADPALGALYAAAITAHGRDAVILDSHAAFVAGIVAIVRAVLPAGTRVLPVGGITPDTMQPWRDAGAAGFGLGSALYKPGLSAAAVQHNAGLFVEALTTARK